MSCYTSRLVFFKAIDHELSGPEEQDFLSHLSSCPDCAEKFAQAKNTDLLLATAIKPIPPPADLTARIMAAYDQTLLEDQAQALSMDSWWTKIRESWRHWRGNFQIRVVAISMALFAIVVFGSSWDKPQPPMVAVNPPNTQIEPAETVQPELPVAEPVVPTVEQAADPIVKETPPQTEPAVEPAVKPEKPLIKPAVEKPAPEVETGTIQLPQAATVQTKEETVDIRPLVEGLAGSGQAPVLAADEKDVYYISVVDHQKQAWRLELTPGAQPIPVNFADIPVVADNKILPSWWPGSLPADGREEVVFDWSPDQQQLAVNLGAAKNGEAEINSPGVWLVQAGGTGPLQLTAVGGGDSLAWSTDGSKIAFSDLDGKIWVLFIRENILVQISNGEDSFRNLRDFIWLSDHKSMIFYGRKNSETRGGIYQITLP